MFGELYERNETQPNINTNYRWNERYKMKGRDAKAFTILAILLASTMIYPAYAQSEIILQIDKNLYSIGESVIISGTVQPSGSMSVIVQVWNPQKEACSLQEVEVNEDGSFVASSVHLSGRACSIPGTYTITAFYGEQEGSATFQVQAPAAVTQAASERLRTLLEILNGAKQNIDHKIKEIEGKGIEIPDDVMATYEQALADVQETEDAVNANDVSAAHRHAKSAMSAFREVFTSLTLLEEQSAEADTVARVAESDDQSRGEEVNQLRMAIARAIEFRERLANIANANNVDADFTEFDDTIQEALDLVEEGNIGEAAQTLAKARQILSNVQELLTQHAKNQREVRAKEFVEKSVQRLDAMIENAKAIGLPHEVIDALENAKAKLLAAKNVNEIMAVAKEIKVEEDEFAEHKGKNFERAVKHIESKLEETMQNAQQAGIELNVLDRIQAMIGEAIVQWNIGETRNAVKILDNAEQLLRQVTGIMGSVKNLLGESDKLASAAKELKDNAVDQAVLNVIERAETLISNARESLMSATSQRDTQTAREMLAQAKQLLERARHMSAVTPLPSSSDVNALKRTAQALEDKAERLKDAAEKQQNREAMSIIMEAINVIQKAKQAISEENHDTAKLLLNEASELLSKAERMLRGGEVKADVASEMQAKAIMRKIHVLEALAADLQEKAGDNEEAYEHIDKAIDDLNDAKSLVEEGKLKEARSKVSDAKENLRKAQQIIEGKGNPNRRG